MFEQLVENVRAPLSADDLGSVSRLPRKQATRRRHLMLRTLLRIIRSYRRSCGLPGSTAA